jgi:hypothetical protein
MNNINQFAPWSSEQKLRVLTSNLLTQIDIILGNVQIAKKHLVPENSEIEELTICIKSIEESALYLKKLRDDLVQS